MAERSMWRQPQHLVHVFSSYLVVQGRSVSEKVNQRAACTVEVLFIQIPIPDYFAPMPIIQPVCFHISTAFHC
jgi:hypothetical protein